MGSTISFFRDVFLSIIAIVVVLYLSSTASKFVTGKLAEPSVSHDAKTPASTFKAFDFFNADESPETSPTPTTTTSKTSQNMVTKLIDCTGPDKVVFKTTESECSKFNNAWGATTATTSLPPKIGVGTTTSPCVLSFGTYDLTFTDCVRFKQQDQAIKAIPSHQIGTAVIVPTTNSNNPSNTYVDYTQQNAQCKDDVQEWFNNQVSSIEAIGRANGSGDSSQVQYKISQAESQARSAVAACDQKYPL